MPITLKHWISFIFVSAINITFAIEFDVLAYQTHLSVEPTKKAFLGVETIQFQSASHSENSPFCLSAASHSNIDIKGNEVDHFVKKGDEICVYFTTELHKSAVYEMTFRYQAMPKKGVVYYPDHLYTLYHTEQWMIVHNELSDRATFELWLTLPKGMTSVSNGSLINIQQHANSETHHWIESRQRPIFTLGFAIGHFKSFHENYDGITFHYLTRNDSETDIKKMFHKIPDIYRFFAQVSGKKLENKDYRFVMTKGNAMQEASGFSLVGERYVRAVLDDTREDWLITHELAHEWWGNAISAQGLNHFWLNEGLTKFMVMAYKQQQDGEAEYQRELILAKEHLLKYFQENTSPLPAVAFASSVK